MTTISKQLFLRQTKQWSLIEYDQAVGFCLFHEKKNPEWKDKESNFTKY